MRDSRALLLALALLVAAQAPARADLDARLEARRAQAKGANFTLLAVDLASGAVLAGYRSEAALRPASNMKLLTTAAALTLLGPDFQHETRVVAQAAPREGVLSGNLYVVGAGDPTISRRFDSEPLLADWAQALWDLGIRRVTGDVVADDRAFEPARVHPSWEAGDLERWYGAEIAALSLNDNCVDVAVGGSAQGVVVQLHPDTRYFTVDTKADLIPSKKGHSFGIQRAGEDRRTLRITGKIWRGASPYESSVPVSDPPLYFATVLRERLQARGIQVDGAARRVGSDEAAAGLTVYARRAPLLRTLAVTNQHSQNFYAECLLKTLGLQKGQGGSWEAGASVVKDYARRCGAELAELGVVDGSGLSRDNRLSARALVAVLRSVARGPLGARFRETLAEPGEEGTLAKRFRRLPAGVQLQAKTGTLRDTSALSGYMTVNGREVAFAFIGSDAAGGTIRQAIDGMVEDLAGELGGR